MVTLGMSLVEMFMLFTAFKAKDFQNNPTVRNMTEWCNSQEIVEDMK